jgi:hypothetical protein
MLQVFLLTLIVLGLALLLMKDVWVPVLVQEILKYDEVYQSHIQNDTEYRIPTNTVATMSHRADEAEYVFTDEVILKEYIDVKLGLHLKYPTFGLKETVLSNTDAQGGVISFYFDGIRDGEKLPEKSWAYDVIIQQNANRLTLLDWGRSWFRCDYFRFSTGTTPYGFDTLWVEIDWEVAHRSQQECDPIGFYTYTVMSPSKKYIINVSEGHDGGPLSQEAGQQMWSIFQTIEER